MSSASVNLSLESGYHGYLGYHASGYHGNHARFRLGNTLFRQRNVSRLMSDVRGRFSKFGGNQTFRLVSGNREIKPEADGK